MTEDGTAPSPWRPGTRTTPAPGRGGALRAFGARGAALAHGGGRHQPEPPALPEPVCVPSARHHQQGHPTRPRRIWHASPSTSPRTVSTLTGTRRPAASRVRRPPDQHGPLADYSGSMYYAGTDDPVSRWRRARRSSRLRRRPSGSLTTCPRRAPGHHVPQRPPAAGPLHLPLQHGQDGAEERPSAFRLSGHARHLHRGTPGEAVLRWLREDPADVLSFDDADVRAGFLTDGRHTSSRRVLPCPLAQDPRVRLYPVSYAPIPWRPRK